MVRQQELSGEISGLTETRVYFRPVKSEQRVPDPERQTIDSHSELDDVEELLDYITRKKLQYPLPLANAGMDEFVSDRVFEVLEDGPDQSIVADLLSMFCSSLEGRQRSEDKYAMLIYFGDSFLLAHVRAERGMSLKEEEGEIELIRRFLDVDNILSAALFEDQEGTIKFSHFTDTGSDSFRGFLGVRKRQYHYRKKNVQIICYYQGNRGFECKFEFTNDEFEDKWLNTGDVELEGDKFSLREGQSHTVKEIRWGNDSYESIESFKSDFKEYSFGLEGERNRYERLISNPSGSETSVYAVEEAVDRRHEIKLEHDDGTTKFVEKGSIPDNLYVLYASSNIRLGSGFADKIFQSIIKDDDVRIYHPSGKPAARELQISGISFLNIDRSEISPEVIDFVERAHDHATTRTGETVSKCLVTVVLQILEQEVPQAFSNGIKQLININTGNPRNRDVVSTKENEGDGLIEFKNKQDLEGDNPASRIISHIQTEKQKRADKKVFLWGFTEQSREVDGLNTQSWNDDRVACIEDHVKDGLDDEGVEFGGFHMQPIELGSNGDRWAIAGVLY